ncbi:hypothetical protein HDU97_002629 [Phlyctochytrium planicorne]|nr:hypothetical protein HDU97_002629 [Phlyctochytrium planicorne]
MVEETLEADVAPAAGPTVENELAVIEKLDAATPVFIENQVVDSRAQLVFGTLQRTRQSFHKSRFSEEEGCRGNQEERVIARIDCDKSAAAMASSVKGTASKTASPIPIQSHTSNHDQWCPAVAVPIQHQLPPRPSPDVAVPRQQLQRYGPSWHMKLQQPQTLGSPPLLRPTRPQDQQQEAVQEAPL